MNCKRLIASIFALTFLLNSPPVKAQSVWDPLDGIYVRQGHQIEWFRGGEMRKEGENIGEVAWVWSDTRNGDRGVYTQVIDLDGNPKFAENGLKIVDEPGRQEDPGVWPDVDGGWFYAWEDFDTDSLGDIYCTKIDADGQRVWGDGIGVPVVVHAGIQEDVRIVHDGQGGCIIAWRDMRGGDTGDLYAMHILNDGTPDPDWTENGNVIVAAAGAQTSHTADIDGAGGMIIGWKDGREIGDANIWAQRISPNGDMLWGVDHEGILICSQESDQETPKLCPDGAGGAFFSWVDQRNVEDTNKDIYVQRVNEGGELMWSAADEGIPLVTAIHQQISNRIVLSEPGTAIIQWEDSRENGAEFDVYAMRINGVEEMVRQWQPEQGKPVVIADRNQTQARVFPDGEGGIYSVWEEEREHPYPELDIWGQRLDVNGEPVWEVNGIPICTAVKLQAQPLVRAHAQGVAVAWADSRTGSLHLYGHLLRPNGTKIWEEDGEPICQGLSGNGKVPMLFPRIHGDNTFAVMWLDGRFGGQGEYPFIQYGVSNPDGTVELLLNEHGIPVIPIEQVGGGVAPDAADAGDNELIVVWEDHRRGQAYSIYAQKMAQNGDRSWAPTGLPVAEFEFDQNTPLVAADGNGGAIITWKAPTDDDYYDIYMQRVSAGSRKLWGDQGIILSGTETDEYVESIISDGEGGAVIVWIKDDADTDDDLWIQRVNSDGDRLWGNGAGLPLCTEEFKQYNSKIILHPEGYVVVWTDKRWEEGTDIFGQFVLPNGEFAWTDGGARICEFDLNQLNPDLAVDTEGKIWVVWEDNRYPAPRVKDIYAQKLDVAANQQGDPNILLMNENNSPAIDGIAICKADRVQEDPAVISDGLGGVYVVWEDFRNNGIHADIIGIQLNSDGSEVGRWETNGSIISNAFHHQLLPQAGLLMEDGTAGAVISWEDYRATGKEQILNVYVQRIDSSSVLGVDDRKVYHPTGYALESVYPNPFNSTSIVTFVIPHDSEVKLTLYDVLGKEILDLNSGYYSAGRHVALVDGKSLSSGTYFVRFAVGDIHLEQRLTLLK